MKSKHVLQAAAVFVLLTAGGLARAAAPQRYAVIIGINDYADPAIPDLKYAESDAKAIYDTLTDPSIGRFPKDNVALILGKQATPSEIKAALYKLRGADKNDLVVVFFSGHGAKEGDDAFWVTQNAQRKAMPATSLSNSEIRKYLKLVPSQRMVILLDCCYAASTVKKSLQDPTKLFGDFVGKGRVTIAGSADSQEALEYEDKKFGVFSYFLVTGLRGAADANTDGVITFEELWDYLGGHVRKASVKQGGLHEPVLISEGGLTPRFLLTFNPKAAAASKKNVQTLLKLLDGGKITGTQFDLGRKALTELALDGPAKARREVFQELVAGRLSPQFLADVLKARVKKAGGSAQSRPVATGGKPALAVVPFDVLGDVAVKDAGRILAEQMLPLFADTHTLIDYARLKQFLDQDRLTAAGLVRELSSSAAGTKGLSKAVKLRAVQYLVVGTVSGSPDGSLRVTARLSDWQTGAIHGNRITQVGADDWRTLLKRLPSLAGRLTGREVAVPAQPAPVAPRPRTRPPRLVGPATLPVGPRRKAVTLDLGKGVTMKLLLIPAGKFLMGSPRGIVPESDEKPQREVTITKPFYMGVAEVTQAQWQAVMGTEPWSGRKYTRTDGDNAVSYVTWNDAAAFCAKLSQKTGRAIRLPTEAEWEYACRAGSKTKYCFGDDDSKLGEYAWYDKNAWDIGEKYAHPVGRKKPNAWGLHDMHGNVGEWCSNWWGLTYYDASGNTVDPTGPASGSLRILRGGNWHYQADVCRSAFRNRAGPDNTGDTVGFRVVFPAVARGRHAGDAKRRQKEAAEKLKIPVEKTLDLAKGVTMKLALIPAGKFQMGSPKTEPGRDDDEDPQREVTITKPFYMGVTEVTQAQWRAVMGTEPWKGKEYAKEGAENAASYVSWVAATAFCKDLSHKTGRTIRLPTEAEWEYACRAGSKTKYCFGDDSSKLGGYAWYSENTHDVGEKYPHPVARTKPNAWGLYDMHGNVWEWCADWYDNTYYSASGNTVDPAGPVTGSARVLRGASWGNTPLNCRAANRNRLTAGYRYLNGFRVVLPVVGRGLPQ